MTSEPRLLVTGGSGFIGTNVIEELGHRSNLAVCNIDIAEPKIKQHRQWWVDRDVRDLPSLQRVFAEFQPTHLVHLAARTDLHGTSLADYDSNTAGVANVVAAAETTNSLVKCVFASSRLVCNISTPPDHEYDYSPPNTYGRSKVIGEQIVRQRASFDWTIVRPTSIWGPWFGVPYRDFFIAVLKNRYVHPAGRTILKSFGYVGNTVLQVEALALGDDPRSSRKTLYLADYTPVSVHAMAEAIRSAIGGRPVRSLPVPLFRAAGFAGSLVQSAGLVREPPLTKFRVGNLLSDMVFDMSPLSEIVGDLPIDMSEGVRLTVQHLQEQGEIR